MNFCLYVVEGGDFYFVVVFLIVYPISFVTYMIDPTTFVLLMFVMPGCFCNPILISTKHDLFTLNNVRVGA